MTLRKYHRGGLSIFIHLKLKEVPLVNREAYPPEEVLPEDGLYQYLLQPGEEHNDQRRRATDRIWSKGTY